MATGTLARLKTIWRDKKITMTSKIRLMHTIIVATALYGCEAWTLSADTERRIQAFEQRCFRRLLCIPYTAHRTNESVWQEINTLAGSQTHLLASVKERKMRWFGHVNRTTGLANTILQGMAEGKRGRGRPRTTWIDNIKSWTGMNAVEIHTNSKNRQTWKELTRAASQKMPPRSSG